MLLRPANNRDGHFEVIYGRRRILACKQLGIPVKALICTLDDRQALMAKGLENANRSELSFYERARFATAIIAQGYERATACQALSVSKNTLSQLERITRIIPDIVGNAIGSASSSGRPKWMGLVAAFENKALDEAESLKLLENCPSGLASDDRLSWLVNTTKQPSVKAQTAEIRMPVEGVQIKSAGGNISMSIKRSGGNAHFANWLDGNLDQLIQDAFEQFKSQDNASKT